MNLRFLVLIVGIVLTVMHSAYSSSIGVPMEENDCICTREYFPICASNGITYSNKCLFECEKEMHNELKMEFEGDCDNEY